MTSPTGNDRRVRHDLVVAEMDGDLVVFDHVAMSCHVLSGGAALVWRALERGHLPTLIAQVAEDVSDLVSPTPDQIEALLDELSELGLLAGPADDGTNGQVRAHRKDG